MGKKKARQWSEDEIATMVNKLFPGPAYAYLRQVRNGTGFARGRDSTADAIAVSCYPSRGLYLIGIEIKVSRSDWVKELKNPGKSVSMQKYCRSWYVAAPDGLIDNGEVPDLWGNIVCGRRAKISKSAPVLDPEPVDILLLCSILRNAAERSVDRAEVENRIQHSVDERTKWAVSLKESATKELQARIKLFEESSGVVIDQWNGDRIGEAVKIVMEHGPLHAIHSAERMRDEYRRQAAFLDKMLTQ